MLIYYVGRQNIMQPMGNTGLLNLQTLLWLCLENAVDRRCFPPQPVPIPLCYADRRYTKNDKKVRNGEALAAAIFARQKLTLFLAQKTICTPVHTSETRRADHARQHRQNFRSRSKIAVFPAMVGTNKKVQK